jgi:hypothetical protein
LEEILKTKEYAYKNANKIVKERRIYEWMEWIIAHNVMN